MFWSKTASNPPCDWARSLSGKEVLIKINLARVYKKNHPRTDMTILKNTITHIYENGGTCAITEGADGYLEENLRISGLGDFLQHHQVKIIDADLADYEEVISNGERHYIPKCFKDYPIRIAIPAASKREEMVYSNNVKLFVGAVPRKMYQLEADAATAVTSTYHAPRARLHLDLHKSIANLFQAMQSYAPFHYYINGGLAYNEHIGEFTLEEVIIGDNAVEMDLAIFQKYFSNCEYPEYLQLYSIY